MTETEIVEYLNHKQTLNNPSPNRFKQDAKDYLQNYAEKTEIEIRDLPTIFYLFSNKETTIPNCQIDACTEKCRFLGWNQGFSKGCCHQHATIASNMAQFGTPTPFASPQVQQKVKQTFLAKYGKESPTNSDQFKATCMERYGVDHPMKSKNIQQNLHTKLNNLYGGIGAGSDIISQRMKNTNVKKFGVECAFSDEVTKKKIIETHQLRYGVDYPSQTRHVRENRKNSDFANLMNKLSGIVSAQFDIDGYSGARNRYNWVCAICGTFFNDRLSGGHIPRCQKCKPVFGGKSKMETELFESLEVDDKMQSVKNILPNKKEIDIWVPSKKIAIEFNGLFWHSELQGKHRQYHLNKTELCAEQGIQLIHVFEHEWVQKPQVIKSIINAKLGLFTTRLFARKCVVREISSTTKSIFLEENHLQGDDKSDVKLGLFHEDVLISVMTFGNSRHHQQYDYEMARYCSKLGFQVVGGASKLFAYFVEKYNPGYVITYADRRFSDGKFYEKIGFKNIGTSTPNYFYFKGSSLKLMSRGLFQKHKLHAILEKFDTSKTEWENMQENGYNRIWDCGNLVYSWKNKTPTTTIPTSGLC